MGKRLLWLTVVLLVVVLLLFFMFRSKDETTTVVTPPDKKPNLTLLMNADGVETAEFQLQDSVIFGAFDLTPITGYDIRIVREEDGLVVSETRLSTDHMGRIPETPIWYNIGLLPCHKYSTAENEKAPLPAAKIRDMSYAGKGYKLSILEKGVAVRELVFHVANKLVRPTLYITDEWGCPKSGFLIGEEDIWVEGRNFPKGSIVRLWAVSAKSDWKDGDPLEDRTKQYVDSMPHLFELKGDEAHFKKLLWPKALTSIGSYDAVAEVVTYRFGYHQVAASAPAQNVVAHRGYTGFVIQRRQGAEEPLEMDIAGAVSSPFAFRSAFLTSENVYVGVDPAVQPSFVGQTADVYIVADKTEAQWVADTSLADVTGVIETIAVNGVCGNCWKTLAWSNPLTEGKYDVVLDFNKDGQYTPGQDLIDSLDATGFTVAKMRVESISFNHSGSGAVTLYDDTSNAIITPPEYLSAAQLVKPAAWPKGGSHSVKAVFKAVSSVSSAKIWADGLLGGINSSASPVTVSFSGGAGQALFNVNSPLNVVDKTLGTWAWKYRDINGASSPPTDMGKTGEHIIYTVLAAPNAPQAQPWVGALEVATSLAGGSATAS
ncbi:MAG: hypothetical protein OEZ04_11505, partial [Nitrospinota bacterium]|nr:hypothetical protein [Nitrospinota bacterium]